jgi:hypothetical protein
MPEIDIGSPKSSVFSVGFLIAWSPSGGTGGTADVPSNGRFDWAKRSLPGLQDKLAAECAWG